MANKYIFIEIWNFPWKINAIDTCTPMCRTWLQISKYQQFNEYTIILPNSFLSIGNDIITRRDFLVCTNEPLHSRKVWHSRALHIWSIAELYHFSIWLFTLGLSCSMVIFYTLFCISLYPWWPLWNNWKAEIWSRIFRSWLQQIKNNDQCSIDNI